jgi:protein gp37
MSTTSIEWTDATWNPVAGCAVISPGCTNCYAMRMAARLQAMGMSKYDGLTRRSGNRWVWTGAVRLDRAALSLPSSWRRSRRIFVNSMSDLFHPDVPTDFVVQIWEVMSRASHHTYQILTKRPDRMAEVTHSFPILKNVWLGTSIENAEYLGRLDHLRRVRAAIHFVSFEPLLASVNGVNLTGIEWAIVGGESGPRARPMQRAWVEEIQLACRTAGTAFFFKQWGGVRKDRTGRTFKGDIFDEMPAARLPS